MSINFQAEKLNYLDLCTLVKCKNFAIFLWQYINTWNVGLFKAL